MIAESRLELEREITTLIQKFSFADIKLAMRIRYNGKEQVKHLDLDQLKDFLEFLRSK